MFRNKIPFRRIVPLFSSKVQNLTVFFFFSIIYMIQIRFFGSTNHFSKGFGRHTITQKEAWWQGCPERPELQGNLIRCFHVTMFFRFADPASVGKSCLGGNKDHQLNQARSELMKKEHQVGYLANCIDELQQQPYSSRFELEDAHHGCIESRQEQARLQEELTITEKVFRKTQIRNIHEMEKKTELKSYELKNFQYKNWEKVMQQYWSSLHKYDKCKSKGILNCSCEFQEIESHYSGGLSYVSSQPSVPLDTWNTSGQQETFLVIYFLLLTPEIITKEFTIFLHQVVQDPLSATGLFFCKLQTQGLLSQDMKIKNRGTIPMPTFAGKYLNCNSSAHHNHFLCWNKTEAQFQCRHLQEGRRPWVIYGGYSTEFHGWTAKAANI